MCLLPLKTLSNLKASLALPSPTFASANKGSQLVPLSPEWQPSCGQRANNNNATMQRANSNNADLSPHPSPDTHRLTSWRAKGISLCPPRPKTPQYAVIIIHVNLLTQFIGKVYNASYHLWDLEMCSLFGKRGIIEGTPKIFPFYSPELLLTETLCSLLTTTVSLGFAGDSTFLPGSQSCGSVSVFLERKTSTSTEHSRQPSSW